MDNTNDTTGNQNPKITQKKKFLSWRSLLFLILGASAGFLFSHFIGCHSGSCPITGNPYLVTAMGGLAGWFLS
jgi:hypothetical protein